MSQNEKNVGFQGEKGSYSEEATNNCIPNSNPIPYKTLEDLFSALKNNEIVNAIIPIENSIEGSVNEAYDLLLESDAKINGEINLRIKHCLIGHKGVNINEVESIYSHPQALGQCRKYIKKLNKKVIPSYDTAGSVKLIKEKGIKNGVAIASRKAAEQYDMEVIDDKIGDNEDNYTRFFYLGEKNPTKTGKDKTSIVFSTSDRAGSLYRALEEFAKRNINLTKIQSRPTREKAWDYNFFVDFEGHIEDNYCKELYDSLAEMCKFVKVLGSYPRA